MRFSTRFADCWRRFLLSPLRKRGDIQSRQIGIRFICRNFQNHLGPRSRSDRSRLEELLRLRSVIGQAIEHARQEKLIGNTLEAAVVLNSRLRRHGEETQEELEEFFIVSDLTIHQAKRSERFGDENGVQKMRALLAPSANRRRKQSASGFVRSLRERGELV